MNIREEIVQELKQSEELLKEEKGYIQFLLEQIQDDTSLKDMIRILQDNKTLKQQLKTTRFIRFFFFFIGLLSFILSVFFVYTNDFESSYPNYNFFFKSIFFFDSDCLFFLSNERIQSTVSKIVS